MTLKATRTLRIEGVLIGRDCIFKIDAKTGADLVLWGDAVPVRNGWPFSDANPFEGRVTNR